MKLKHREGDLAEAHSATKTATTVGTLAATAAALAACGGGTSGDSLPTHSEKAAAVEDIYVVDDSTNAAQASRFLSQAAFGGNDTSIAEVQSLGLTRWINQQIEMPRTESHKDWLIRYEKHTTASSLDGSNLWVNTIWRKTMSSPDVLRQRMVLALSELFVVSMDGLLTLPKANFAIAHYADLLEENAFGNFRTLLEAVTLSSAMGTYLSMKGNRKADIALNRVPDENFAREIMQLFTIGLYVLDGSGNPVTGINGKPIETYTNQDIQGIAAALTGWDQSVQFDSTGRYPSTNTDATNAYRHTVPMALTGNHHESAPKSFLGTTIPAGTSGTESLRIVLDTLFNHSNTPAFVCKFLIQRFVTSNPSPAYVARVANVFKDNGSRVRGDLGAVIKKILLDSEARLVNGAITQGKLREPMIRLMQWARTFNGSDATATNASTLPWALPPTHTDNNLSQSPFLSPSVFNFFRPAYVPPNTEIANRNLVTPEFQIATEPTVASYVNYMVDTIQNTRNVKANYPAELITLAASNSTTQALIDKLNLWLTANQLSVDTVSIIIDGVNGMPINSNNADILAEQKRFRLYAAILMVMCSPQYLVQK